ncbi:SDR family NAD(P)-dependent oxidoreductase [Streptomyces sp. NPDC051217]|uniref:SDR family NAD(P)-dependent oxidoreductase n=1 Tax=Streptomyces sp. NPDC051217 TaxID=3365644 RepID=UPI00378856EA
MTPGVPKLVPETPYLWRARRPGSRRRLVCFPHAGAGAAAYADWAPLLPPDVELVAVQLPGRQNRVAEQPFTEVPPLTATLSQALRPVLDGPLTFFGHSCGAMLAYETAKELRLRGYREPDHLFLSAQPAPGARGVRQLHQLPDDKFHRGVAALGGIDPEILEDEYMMSSLLPLLRADFALWEQYRPTPGAPLDCGITALVGESDPRGTPRNVRGWRDCTTGPFELRTYPGGHFYFLHALAPVIALVAGETPVRRRKKGEADGKNLDDIVAAVPDVPGVTEAYAVERERIRTAVRSRSLKPTAPAVDGVTTMAELDGGDSSIPPDAPTTLQEALRAAAELAPDKGTIFITQGNDDVLQTYPELLSEAEHTLAGLRAAGLRPGDAALFQFQDNREFLIAFWACVLGGFLPTPVAVAPTYERPNEANRKTYSAWILLGRPPLLTDTATAGSLAAVRKLWDEPGARVLTVAQLRADVRDSDWYPATGESPVLNLLTSGSTGLPKCVQHTNASVAARTYAVARHCGLASDDVSLIWMPFDHVTVAMYNVRDVFLRCLHVNAKIDHFLADPLLWFDWADRYGATNTWAPNFAFAMVNASAEEICTQRSWDLSRLREITNGGEPVAFATSQRFLELLAPHGLSADAMTPSWGMSETCSGVTYSRLRRRDPSVGTVAIDRSSLGGDIRTVDPADGGAMVLCRVGQPIPGVRIRVVDDTGVVLPEGRLGELLIRGRTMMRGYFANAEANLESFADGWFRTGDLAFVYEGEVIIAGRRKDQIIVRGINYPAHELEQIVEQADGVQVTYAAVAGVGEPGADSEQMVVFFVPQRWEANAVARIVDEIRARLVRESGLGPDLVVPVTEAEFPKTASGKIQRSALVTAFRAGAFADRVVAGRTRNEDDTWIFRRHWTEVPAVTPGSEPAGPCLVLAEDSDLPRLDVLVPHLAASRSRVRADERKEMHRLLTAATAELGPLSTIVYALPLAGEGAPPSRFAIVTAELAAITGCLADGEFGNPLVLVVTAGAVHAAVGDRVDLGSCGVPGLVRTARAETASVVVRQLDLPADPRAWAPALRGELADREYAGIVAVRQGRRWRPKLVPVHEAESSAKPPVTEGGLYLVTGGLGGIGHDLLSYLLAVFGIRAVVIGRSHPDADRLVELTTLGDVQYHQLDVGDTAAVDAAVASAERRWERPLDGVFHLASADPTGQWADLERHTLAQESASAFVEQYHPKVAGTLSLAEVLETRPEASLVLFGSVNGEFGGHSFGAYSAANSFLVGFADHWRYERGREVRCLAWSMWTGIGMNRGQPVGPARRRGFRSIDPTDGLRLFLEVFGLPDHYLVIGLDAANPAIVEDLVPDRLDVAEVVGISTAMGADPAVHRLAVTPPVGELERRVCAIWSDALGRREVGRDETFFDLGGNSLHAIRLLAMVADRLTVRIPIQELYENPTVAGMAAAITRLTPEVAADA